ncbi:MAG: ABC transporter substrate-binding protein [Opitutaceae bacterium]|nr:ABC transporter substrate-binding protein [Opitutaceae bacterium]
MSSIATSPQLVEGKPARLTEVAYTICSVYVSSHVALQLGWIEEELRKVGASLRYLRSIEDPQVHLAHFSHRLDNLVRDGGLVPPIWARADVAKTRLIGTTSFHSGGQIVVRADSGIHTLAQLKGRRFALPASRIEGKVDWWRANSERALEAVLSLGGLTRADVEIVDAVAEDDPRRFGTAANPGESLRQHRVQNAPSWAPEIPFLEAGLADAIFSNFGLATGLERTGRYTVITDFSRLPDWTLQSANSPYVLTVSETLADEHPEIVVAYLRAAVRAARWINKNREAAAELFHRTTYLPSTADTARAIAEVDFLHNFEPRNLAAIELEKQFLLSHGYIKNDFDLNQWIDRRFLEEAVRTL